MDEMARVISEYSKVEQEVESVEQDIKIEIDQEMTETKNTTGKLAHPCKVELLILDSSRISSKSYVIFLEKAEEVAPGVQVADSENWNEIENLVEESTTVGFGEMVIL